MAPAVGYSPRPTPIGLAGRPRDVRRVAVRRAWASPHIERYARTASATLRRGTPRHGGFGRRHGRLAADPARRLLTPRDPRRCRADCQAHVPRLARYEPRPLPWREPPARCLAPLRAA